MSSYEKHYVTHAHKKTVNSCINMIYYLNIFFQQFLTMKTKFYGWRVPLVDLYDQDTYMR